MSTLLTTPADTGPLDAATGAARRTVTLRRVVGAEWLKFRTARSNVIGLAAAAVVAVLLGVLFSSLAGSGQAMDGPAARAGTNPLSLSLAGFNVAQLIVGVFGVLIAAGEYSTGLIRATFVAVGRRLPVLWAKAITYGLVVLVTMGVATLVAFLAAQAAYAGDAATYSLGDAGVMRALAGQAIYLTAIGMIGVALGFLLRSTAAAVGALVTGLMILPILVPLLPDSISDTLDKLLPSSAGTAISSLTTAPGSLTVGQGYLVLALWVAGLVGAAAMLLTRRDA